MKSADATGREDIILDFADELDMTPLGAVCDSAMMKVRVISSSTVITFRANSSHSDLTCSP